MDISTPGHARYGQHLKRDDLKELVKPRAESTDAVLAWLKESGVESKDIANDGEWINFVAPVSTAEAMMDTTFKTYQSLVRDDIQKVRALQYSVPEDVREHIDLIQPTTRFGQVEAQISLIHDQEEVPDAAVADMGVAAVNATCNYSITPQCLAELYNFADFKAHPNVSTVIGVTGFLEQYARFKDFAQWARMYSPKAVNSNFTWSSVNGMCSFALRVIPY